MTPCPPEAKRLLRRCPVCGGELGLILTHRGFALEPGHPLPAAYDVAVCTGCGFTFADTPAGQDAYERYYTLQSKYADPSVATGGGDSQRDRARLERTAADIARHATGREAPVVDIGCGSGGLLDVLLRHGFTDLHGLDPSPECVQRLHARGLRCSQGGIVGWRPERRFGLLILCHVLEHVRDLRTAMQRLAQAAEPGALVYAEVPDASRYPDHWVVPDYYFDIEHINHFDPDALSALFARHGFVAEEVGRKQLEVGPGRSYPAAFGFFRNHGAPQPGLCGPGSAAGVREHVRQSQAAATYGELDELARSRVPLALWGAGNFALRLLQDSPLGSCDLRLVVDSDGKKLGTRFAGLPVSPPAALLGWEGPIVICSALFSADLVAAVRAMGLANRLVLLADAPAPVGARTD